MGLPIYQVDAFTSQLYGGNPAAVVVLDHWCDAPLMQAIASENNLSETAFLVRSSQAEVDFDIRWFTPIAEVPLCGHATLASAFVLFHERGWQREDIRFASASSVLIARREENGLITLNFPACDSIAMPVPEGLEAAIGRPVASFHRAKMNMAVLGSAACVRAATPDLDYIRACEGDGLIITAQGVDSDCVSRYFAPHIGIDEDPVTGAAHCTIIPYWAARLGKQSIHARQVSARGGELWCRLAGDRVLISGQARLYLTGQIHQ